MREGHLSLLKKKETCKEATSLNQLVKEVQSEVEKKMATGLFTHNY